MKTGVLLENQIIKNILSALAVLVFGFILLNLAFMFDFLIQSLVVGLIKLFTPVNFETNFQWLPPALHGLFVVIIGVISWFVFRSKLGTLYKAVYMTVPVAVIFVTIGMSLYRWPVVAYSLGGLFGVGVLYYFYRTKKPWLYSYTVVLVGLTLAIFSLSGGEI